MRYYRKSYGVQKSSNLLYVKYQKISIVYAISHLASNQDLYYLEDYIEDKPIIKKVNPRDYTSLGLCRFLNEYSDQLFILR